MLVFEPDADNYRYVLRNLELNGLDNVTAVQSAVTDSCGTRTFTVSDVTDARHTFFRSSFRGTGTSVEVPCVSLPAALEQHGVGRADVHGAVQPHRVTVAARRA